MGGPRWAEQQKEGTFRKRDFRKKGPRWKFFSAPEVERWGSVGADCFDWSLRISGLFTRPLRIHTTTLCLPLQNPHPSTFGFMSFVEEIFTPQILTSYLLFSSFFSLLQMSGYWSAKKKAGRLHVALCPRDVGAGLLTLLLSSALAGPQSLGVLYFVSEW